MSLINDITLNYGSISVDAGARLRVGLLTTLLDGKTLGFDRPLLWENAGDGTGTWANNMYTMSVTSGQWRVRQTKRFYTYFSGKSQQVECTFDDFGAEANITKRVGYFSSNATTPFASTYDGFWLENNGTTIYLKAANAGTETLSKSIDQWSGYANLAEYQTVATWANFTVVMFDFLWLGGAVLRLWVRTAAGFVLAHQFNYPGTAAGTFIKSPNQPVRYEIRSTTGSGDFRWICCQVATEGSLDEEGNSRGIDTGSSLITLATAGTTYPVKAIRKASAYRDSGVKVIDLSVFVGSINDQMRWSLELNPTLSAPLTYSAVANSAAEEASGNGTITVTTPGTVLWTNASAQNATLPTAALQRNFLSWLGGTLANAMDEIVLCGTPITSSVTGYGGIVYLDY